jgi:uncharacterized protein with HEPN domain
MKNDLLYLSNIQECIVAIELFTKDGRESFNGDRMIQDAVIRNLEVIGEATKRLSPQLRDTYSEIPWRQIAGLRDILIHDYLKVNLSEVWYVVEHDLPQLKIQISQIIDRLQNLPDNHDRSNS